MEEGQNVIWEGRTGKVIRVYTSFDSQGTDGECRVEFDDNGEILILSCDAVQDGQII